jgi:hypothetical protein
MTNWGASSANTHSRTSTKPLQWTPDLGHPMCVVLAHHFSGLKLRCATFTLRNCQADHSGSN